jgi:hypothetical protein
MTASNKPCVPSHDQLILALELIVSLKKLNTDELRDVAVRALELCGTPGCKHESKPISGPTKAK